MRIKCPLCGERDRREFYYLGAKDYLNRPKEADLDSIHKYLHICLLYTSPSPRDQRGSRMPSSA